MSRTIMATPEFLRLLRKCALNQNAHQVGLFGSHLSKYQNTSSYNPDIFNIKSHVPAWVPAITVACAMLVFLATSFYHRHLRVVRKRELLMDYFYIILQYRGPERKRMVTAICNTNAITLRDLGKSFMVSMDSGSENHPLESGGYYDDSAFTETPLMPNRHKSKPSFYYKKWNKSMGQYETKSKQGASTSMSDIVMRFKRKKSSTPQQNQSYESSGPRPMSALSSIHIDESDTLKVKRGYENPTQYKMAGVVKDVLQSSVNGAYEREDFLTVQSEVLGRAGRFKSRKKETSILIQGPSLDDSGQTNINEASDDGVVVLKRVATGDGQYVYFGEEQTSTSSQRDPRDRPKLSKVSSVRSGNTSEICYSLNSPKNKRNNDTRFLTIDQDGVANTLNPVMYTRRRKMSIGEIAEGNFGDCNFNQRIVEFPSEWDINSQDGSSRLSTSPVNQKSRSRKAWTKFKNVFSNSTEVYSQRKGSKCSQSSTEERPKWRNDKEKKHWNKFFNTFNGLRSLQSSSNSSGSTKHTYSGDVIQNPTSVLQTDEFDTPRMESDEQRQCFSLARSVHSEEFPTRSSLKPKIPNKAFSLPEDYLLGKKYNTELHHSINTSGTLNEQPSLSHFNLSVGSREDQNYFSDGLFPYINVQTPSPVEAHFFEGEMFADCTQGLQNTQPEVPSTFNLPTIACQHEHVSNLIFDSTQMEDVYGTDNLFKQSLEGDSQSNLYMEYRHGPHNIEPYSWNDPTVTSPRFTYAQEDVFTGHESLQCATPTSNKSHLTFGSPTDSSSALSLNSPRLASLTPPCLHPGSNQLPQQLQDCPEISQRLVFRTNSHPNIPSYSESNRRHSVSESKANYHRRERGSFPLIYLSTDKVHPSIDTISNSWEELPMPGAHPGLANSK